MSRAPFDFIGSLTAWTSTCSPRLIRSWIRLPCALALELGDDDLVDVEEAVLLEADLDERGLHPRQDVVDRAEVDVPGDRAALGPLEVDLGDAVVLEDGDALLADVDAHEELALRGRELRALLRDAAAAAGSRGARGAASEPPPSSPRLRLGLAARPSPPSPPRWQCPSSSRPLPPRVPRRRFGRGGSVVVGCSPPAVAAGSSLRLEAALERLPRCRRLLRLLRRRNQESGKRYTPCSARGRTSTPQGAGARAGLSGAKTRALLPSGYQRPRRGPSVRSRSYASRAVSNAEEAPMSPTEEAFELLLIEEATPGSSTSRRPGSDRDPVQGGRALGLGSPQPAPTARSARRRSPAPPRRRVRLEVPDRRLAERARARVRDAALHRPAARPG